MEQIWLDHGHQRQSLSSITCCIVIIIKSSFHRPLSSHEQTKHNSQFIASILNNIEHMKQVHGIQVFHKYVFHRPCTRARRAWCAATFWCSWTSKPSLVNTSRSISVSFAAPGRRLKWLSALKCSLLIMMQSPRFSEVIRYLSDNSSCRLNANSKQTN